MTVSHIDSKILTQFHNGQLTSRQEQELLIHISECTFCATLFSDSFCGETLLNSPLHLKGEILTKSKKCDISLTRNINHFTKRTQLFFYGVQVSCGILGALALLLSFRFFPLDMDVTQNMPPTVTIYSSLTDTIQQKTNDFSAYLNQFTTNLLY